MCPRQEAGDEPPHLTAVPSGCHPANQEADNEDEPQG